MLFNSYSFIFIFLPIVWGIYWYLRGKSSNLGLLALTLGSLVFYGYWNIKFLPLLLFSILVNFLVGERLHKQQNNRLWLTFGMVFNLGLLCFFKYMNFFSDVVEQVSGAPLFNFNIILPIGISFFTFQQITYLVDVHKQTAPRYSPLHYTLFVSFFPQLISGPIVHHSEMLPQFAQNKRPTSMNVAIGLSIFIAGLFKKLVLADNIAPFASAIFAASDTGLAVSFVETWAALVAFSFQMYFDFCGYTDMALGLGLMFGIRLPINFNSPYKAKSIAEYWQRWNMTLGRFLRDYVYIPLGGSRRGELFHIFNLFMVMAVSGVWHGAGWGFVLWGFLNGFWLIANHFSARTHDLLGKKRGTLIPRWLACVMTFAAVSFGWCFFKSVSTQGAFSLAATSLGFNGLTIPAEFGIALGPIAGYLTALGFTFTGEFYVPIGDWALIAVPMITMCFIIVWAMPNTVQIFLSNDETYKIEPPKTIRWRPNLFCLVIMSFVFVIAMLFASEISEFLYFQF